MWWSGVVSLIVICIENIVCDSTVFRLTKSQLNAAIDSKQFTQIKNVLKYEGVLALTDLGEDYRQAVQQLKLSAPTCLKELRYPEFVLPDGSIRTTFATESSQPYTQISEYPECIQKTSSVISEHFDSVFQSISVLFEELTNKESLSWRQDDGTVRQFNQLSRKEHIHVYEHGEAESRSDAVPFHTDNGILLLITPFQEHPLQVKSLGGKLIDTSSLGDSDILILIARGMPEWLLRGSREATQFRAAPHAVPSLKPDLESRTIFARMMVADLEAVPTSPAAHKVPFKQIFFNQITQNDLCLGDHLKQDYLSRIPRDTNHDHHNHHMNMTMEKFDKLKKDECTDPTTSYCWMGCLDLPDDCSQDNFMCTNSAGRDCCTDPSQEGTGTCADMDPTCTWKCEPPTTAHAHDTTAHSHDTTAHSSGTTAHTSGTTAHTKDDERFCIPGTGTDMYMNGFQVSGQKNNPCIILFFKSWVLDTPFKFAMGCIGVIILGIGVEGLLCFRRLLQSRKILRVISSPVRRGGIIALFGFNIAFGYLAMLVAMTYSIELFICMVIGLVIGHGIFNTTAPVGETVDPCCASQVVPPSNHSQSSDSSHSSHISDLHSYINLQKQED